MVLLESEAGLTTITLPVSSSALSVWLRVAVCPRRTRLAWFCGILTRATTREMSITVSSAVPGTAISPAYRGRSAITPETGLTMRE